MSKEEEARSVFSVPITFQDLSMNSSLMKTSLIFHHFKRAYMLKLKFHVDLLPQFFQSHGHFIVRVLQ